MLLICNSISVHPALTAALWTNHMCNWSDKNHLSCGVWITCPAHPANARRWIIVGLTLVQRLRRWTDVKPTMIQRLVSAGQRTLRVCAFKWLLIVWTALPSHQLYQYCPRRLAGVEYCWSHCGWNRRFQPQIVQTKSWDIPFHGHI